MNILLVEDDSKTALYVTEGLQKHGHEVRWAPTGTDGITQLKDSNFDLAIVDRMLPNLDGLSLVKTFRAEGGAIPILFLTTMTGLDDRVEGLNAGADDYLTKPFALSELLARLNAIVRRTHLLGNGDMQTHLRSGSLEMDLIARKVTREGQIVDLQHQEFKLLKYFLQNAGRTVTRTMLLENVWDVNFNPQTNIVESHISRLRSKVNRGFEAEIIHTLRGVGYVLRAD
jgi:two-component system, OmpR family, response regulator